MKHLTLKNIAITLIVITVVVGVIWGFKGFSNSKTKTEPPAETKVEKQKTESPPPAEEPGSDQTTDISTMKTGEETDIEKMINSLPSEGEEGWSRNERTETNPDGTVTKYVHRKKVSYVEE